MNHRAILAISHLIYGTVSALSLFFTATAVTGILGMDSSLFSSLENGTSSGSSIFEGRLITLLWAVIPFLSVPFLLTGYALWKDKGWVKASGIIAIILSIMSFPVGTVLAGYTIWFLFGRRDESG